MKLFVERLPKRAAVLDAGCGSGYPVTQLLAQSFHVTGVDFSDQQLQLARTNLPDSALVCSDIAKMPFKENVFDGLCSYYAIIHLPRREHPKLLADLHRILKTGGLALLCMGAGDLPEDTGAYQGTEMFWSHYDKETNLTMMKESGFSIIWSKVVKDPIDAPSAHLFVLGEKRSGETSEPND
ncbi:MAG TPA: class I SAM-dependent methyltransferase [Candidatus Angelobacter sp.]|nr:class I SAM-dependent methyltransferase [Candidatus Angelobacter sp.]